MNKLTADFHLPIFKQGCDLHYHLDQNQGDCEKALFAYSANLQFAADLVTQLANEIKDKSDVTIDADTHWISVTGPEQVITQLIKKDLLTPSQFDDEDEEEDLDC